MSVLAVSRYPGPGRFGSVSVRPSPLSECPTPEPSHLHAAMSGSPASCLLPWLSVSVPRPPLIPPRRRHSVVPRPSPVHCSAGACPTHVPLGATQTRPGESKCRYLSARGGLRRLITIVTRLGEPHTSAQVSVSGRESRGTGPVPRPTTVFPV